MGPMGKLLKPETSDPTLASEGVEGLGKSDKLQTYRSCYTYSLHCSSFFG